MITVVTGKEIEKIKGEFESVINGMNTPSIQSYLTLEQSGFKKRMS